MTDISFPVAVVMTAGGSVLTVGVAWGMMRQRVTASEKRANEDRISIEKRLDRLDADIRAGFDRISAIERESVTREMLSEFRREMIGELHGIRDLIEKLRSPRTRREDP